jgi:hypothetical protein
MKMNIVVKNERVHWKYDGWGDASEELLVTNDDFQTAFRELTVQTGLIALRLNKDMV